MLDAIAKSAKYPPVTIKLHWPDRWCKECMGETEYLPMELYRCLSCGRISTGRTEYITGEARLVGPNAPS